MKIAIITGGTSGIGLETAKVLAEKGCKVYEFSRRDAEFAFMKHMRVDISDEAQVRTAVEKIHNQEGRIDILVNNAGFGISGAFEFTSSDEAHRLLEVNLFGMNNCIRAVLPHMRRQKSGRIVNLSSVAGPLPIPFQSWYSISKAAVNALTMALANEVHCYGISVCCVMPGDIRTGFTAARQKNILGDDQYGGRISRSVSRMEKDEQNGMSPAVAGRFIANLATKKRVKPYNTIGFMYKCCILLSKILPGSMVRFILEMMYAR
ncbi:MAG: SDR family oxidoreductase [Clostridia bacterium]|nr:SDR family oxidoreductase [Clostridia bacterium]